MSSVNDAVITRPPVEIYGRHLGYGFAGLGVNTAIGNFTHTATDLLFPVGLLGLLDWQRTYNSHSGAVGALGPGWSVSLSARLVAAASGPASLSDEDGRVLTFEPAPGGGYLRAQDLDADLTRAKDGTFTLTYNSGLVWSFDTAGRLTGRSMEGQRVALDYDSNDLLVLATHSPSGRSLSFSHDANRRLTSVAANDGRTVSFGYTSGDVTSALLASVTLPGGATTKFEWSGTGQDAQISTVTDADGHQLIANTYNDPGRRVSAQAYPGAGGGDFHYDDATGVTTVTYTPLGIQFSFAANPQGRMIKATGPDGNAATFSYSDAGYLAEATTPGGTHLSQTRDSRGNVLSSTFAGATTTSAYDDHDRPIQLTGPDGALTSYGYSGDSHLPVKITGPGTAVTQFTVADGLITSRTDADGGTTDFAYSDGNLSSLTTAVGQTGTFSYDAAGRRTAMTTAPSATIAYAYDDHGRLASVTNALGAQTSFQYTAAGLLTAVTDAADAVTHYGYNDAGQLETVTDALDRILSFGYDPQGNLTSIKDSAGNTTAFGFDQLARLTSMTYPDGTEVGYGYDADGNQITATGPAGTSHVRFDGAGRPTEITDAVGSSASYAYDQAGRPTAVTGPDGQTWRTQYSAAGYPVASIDPLNGQLLQSWSPGGRITSTTDEEGRQVTYDHDQAGRVVSVTDGEGGVTRYGYDQQGRRTFVTTPAGLTTRFRYNTAGQLVAVVSPRGWVTRYEYDKLGHKTAEILPSGAVTRYRYDATAQLTEVVGADGSVIRYGYDGTGNLTSVTSPKETVTQYGYDKNGRLISITDSLGRTTRHGYDKAGNLTEVTDPAGHTQHFSYDAARLLTSRTADDGTEVSYTYDSSGRRVSMTDATGTTHYTYDAAGRLVTVTDPDRATTTATYNQAGQRTGLTYPDGLTVSYEYDLNGRLISMTDSRAGTATYALDPDGRLLTEELPGRMARRYHYGGGLLSRFTVYREDHPVATATFGRDPEGGIIAWQGDEYLREYRYDPVGRLVFAATTGFARQEHQHEHQEHDHEHPERDHGHPERAELHLSYDATGNRVRLQHDDTEVHYRYDDASQLVAQESRGRHTEYQYDSSGRLIEASGEGHHKAITYDGFGRAVAFTQSHPESVTEQIRATYDGDNRLVALSIRVIDERHEEEGLSSVRYRWGSVNNVPQIFSQRVEPELDSAEHDRPGRLSADFSYGYGRTFASWDRGHAAFHHDAFGSAVRTEETEAWAQARHYTPFGAPEDAPETGDARPHREEFHPGPPSPELPRFGYRGELALGPVIYLRARVYDSASGRFTTQDPLSLEVGGANPVHPYTYANNDPLNVTDPLGTLPVATPPGQVSLFESTLGVLQDCNLTALLHPPGVQPPPPPTVEPGPSPATLARLAGDLKSGNFTDIARTLQIRRQLLFPKAKPPQTVPELVGGNGYTCGRFGTGCGHVAQVPVYHNDNTPGSLGLEWVSGIGGRDQHFNQYDPFTQTLRQDTNVQETRVQIRQDLQCGGPYSGSAPYSDPRNPLQFLKDMSGVFGFHIPGITPSNPADGFLGSYSLTWAAVPYTGSWATAFFTVTNTSDLNSFFHPEITKYPMLAAGGFGAIGLGLSFVGLWAVLHHNDIDGLAPFRQQPGGKTTQTVQWQETIGY